jgi:hypothetical protein
VVYMRGRLWLRRFVMRMVVHKILSSPKIGSECSKKL